MFQFQIVSLLATPLAATADEIQPWMIAAIAAGAVLALILIIVAARKARGPKGDDIRETMEAAKMEAADSMANDNPLANIPSPMDPEIPEQPAPPESKGKYKGKHAK